MSKKLYMGEQMSSEEKRAWIMVLVTLVAYPTYIAIIMNRRGNAGLAHVAYESTTLRIVGVSIAVGIVLNILAAIFTPGSTSKKDPREREINRVGESVGQGWVVLAGVGALVMSLYKVDYFWISNALYLGFSLSAIFSSATKIVGHRSGFIRI
jgi:hypothetical protein